MTRRPVGGVDSGEPAISVVVPTRGAALAVIELLRTLRIAVDTLPAGVEAEMVVVDDSTPADTCVIQQCCTSVGARYQRGPRRVGAKRNLGTRLTHAPLVMYVDSDCLVPPDLLLRHLRAHADLRAPSGLPVGAVAGPTLVPDAVQQPAWRVVASSVVVNSPWQWPARFAEVWWAATSNLSVRRDAFDAIGGFDERTFTVVGGEDVDFGVRLTAAGYATVCVPEAVVTHRTDGITRVRQFCRKMFRYGRACTYNCMRQPEHARWSANPVSLAALGLLGGAAARRAGSRAAPAVLAITAAATAGRFGVRAAAARRAQPTTAADAVRSVLVDWCFDAGIAAEAVLRRRPWLAFRRYDYLQPHRFSPLPGGTG